MKGHRSRWFVVAALVPALTLPTACGSDEAEVKPPAASTNGGNAGGVPAGPQEPCPLTAAEVGEVVGVAVEQDSLTCTFEPAPGKEPRVLYVRQVSVACSDAVVNDASFWLEPFEGLGVRAFASPDSGDILVCTNPPFEITVDITPDLDAVVADAEAASAAARASERAAAEQLARLVLDR